MSGWSTTAPAECTWPRTYSTGGTPWSWSTRCPTPLSPEIRSAMPDVLSRTVPGPVLFARYAFPPNTAASADPEELFGYATTHRHRRSHPSPW